MSKTTTTMVHVRVPLKLKKEAKKVADELGVSLSLIAEQAFREFSTTKKLVVEEPLTPTPYLAKILREAERDRREGNTEAFSGPFTGDEFIAHLESLSLSKR